MVWETARMRSVTLVGWESATRCEAPIWTMWAPAPAGPPPRGTGSITKERHAVTPSRRRGAAGLYSGRTRETGDRPPAHPLPKEPAVDIVDSQVHLWGADTPD